MSVSSLGESREGVGRDSLAEYSHDAEDGVSDSLVALAEEVRDESREVLVLQCGKAVDGAGLSGGRLGVDEVGEGLERHPPHISEGLDETLWDRFVVWREMLQQGSDGRGAKGPE